MSYIEKIEQVDLLQEEIAAHGPIHPDVQKKINYKFRLEWNYTSNNMEGNSLTRQETRSVMVGNITVGGKPIKDVLEMKGHDDLIAEILKMGKGELNISESRIRDIHMAIVHEEDPVKKVQVGHWKTESNYLYNYKNERFDFVAPEDVPEWMHQLINWLHAEQEKIKRGDKRALHPVMLAFKFHLDYIVIHPFYDGNGRTARILTNIILIAYGYPPLYIREEEKGMYYQYLADIQGYGGDEDLFYEFMADLLLRSLSLVKGAIEGIDINDPNDWEKRLLLLKTKTETINLTGHRNIEGVKNVGLEFIIPLVHQMLLQYRKFEDLFFDRYVAAYTNLNVLSIQSADDLDSFFTIENRRLQHLGINYRLSGFKYNGESKFDAIADVFFEFKDSVVNIKLGNTFSKTYPYGHQFTANETADIINKGGEILMDQIDKKGIADQSS